MRKIIITIVGTEVALTIEEDGNARPLNAHDTIVFLEKVKMELVNKALDKFTINIP